ncbi:MAG: FhaA domain-containing protein [Solirubrobacteraceae bacterium]
MNPLRRIENAIAGLVEGGFGRAFRSEVRPMELAHKLAREMDEHATASVSRTYAPNEYSVWLSERDRERYEGVEHEIVEELCAYLLEHARREGYALASALHVVFHTDESLQLGEFGIQAQMSRDDDEVSPVRESSPERVGASPPEQPREDGGRTMIYSNAERMREAVQATGMSRRAKALLVVSGRRVVVPPHGAVLGRSRECDVVLDDSSVSRRHAQLRPQGEDWTLEDMGSTNGVRVNGSPVRAPRVLAPGDRIELGSTEMLFEVSR